MTAALRPGDRLPVLALPGLTLDTLGHYLAALGLLQAATWNPAWPQLRGAWHDERFLLIGGPERLDSLASWLVGTFSQVLPEVEYLRWWEDAQKRSTELRDTEPLRRFRSDAQERMLPFLDSHLLALGSGRRVFNPLTGTGGNAGKRIFENGYAAALLELRESRPHRREQAQHDCARFLRGEPCEILGAWNAASWFSAANKTFNSGTAHPYRDGQISLWAMLLACQGLPFFAGSVARRLGAHTRSFGAFPFVLKAAGPPTVAQRERSQGEVWAPVWDRPMTLTEALWLFQRARIEVGGRGATQPALAAAAILRRGVDAGLVEFRRFQLLHTTSQQTFESRLSEVVPVQAKLPHPLREAVTQVRRAYQGLHAPALAGAATGDVISSLQGLLDEALTHLAAAPRKLEASLSLLDTLVAVYDRVDRTLDLRKARSLLPLLPPAWLFELLRHHEQPAEFRVALALASLPDAILHRFHVELPAAPIQKEGTATKKRGVKPRTARFLGPSNPRRVFSPVAVEQNLAAMLLKRLTPLRGDDEHDSRRQTALTGVLEASFNDLSLLLCGQSDRELLARWLDRLLLFDWAIADHHRWRPLMKGRTPPPLVPPEAAGRVSLFGLLKPLFQTSLGDRVFGQGSARKPDTPAALRCIVHAIDRRDVPHLVALADSRYHVAGRALLRVAALPDPGDPAPLLAALLCPCRSLNKLERLAHRWLHHRDNDEDDR